MNNHRWQYRTKQPIRTLKDLRAEKQKLALHQQFLGELLENDKELLKKSLDPKHLMALAVANVFDSKNGSSTDDLFGDGKGLYGFFFQIGKWLMKKIIG